MAWRQANRENALFIAPLAKGSLLAAQDGPVLVDLRQKLFNHLYPAHHYGVRLGHFAIDSRSNVAPELVSFMDVTVGQFHNFRVAGPPVVNPGYSDGAVIPTRVEFQGRFKIPSTPLTIGFSANMGRGRDDMRVFFGTRFDIGRLLARALPSVNE